MKVLLATLSIEEESRATDHPDAPYSIGLAYIQSMLEQEGHQTRLLFLNNVSQEISESNFFAQVEAWVPDIVAFQVFSMNRVSTYAAMRRLTTNYPSIKIVLGGVHVSVMYEQLVKAFPHVIAVRGEGELTIAELVKCLHDELPLDTVAGIVYQESGNVIVTPPRCLVTELDQLPIPRHESFFDLEPTRTVAHMVTSRGCPFDCSFCCLKAVSQRKYRARGIESVITEIAHLKKTYPRLQRIQFHDDTLLLDNKRMIALCKRLMEEQFSLTYICSARVKPVSEEMFSFMEQAGFVKIMFGLETGSTRLLDSIHKKITPDDVYNLFNMLKPFNFMVTTFLMCGFPGESDETVAETIDVVKATQRIYYNCIMGIGKLWVYPGTEIHEIMKQRDVISDDFWLGEQPVPYFTAEHSLNQLIVFEERMMDSLSISRVLTWQGFKNQFLSMPLTIIMFLVRGKNREIVVNIIQHFIERHLPRLYPTIQRLYRKSKVTANASH